MQAQCITVSIGFQWPKYRKNTSPVIRCNIAIMEMLSPRLQNWLHLPFQLYHKGINITTNFPPNQSSGLKLSLQPCDHLPTFSLWQWWDDLPETGLIDILPSCILFVKPLVQHVLQRLLAFINLRGQRIRVNSDLLEKPQLEGFQTSLSSQFEGTQVL